MKHFVILILLIVGIVSCKKNKTINATSADYYFMTATINGNVWFDSTFGQPGFSSSNLWRSNHSGYEIFVTDERPNTICNGISISLYLVPQIGRYYFNGSSLGVSSDSGAVAVYTNNRNLNDPYKTSTSGYVDIKAITPEYIKGEFNFKAVGSPAYPDTVYITNGLFYVQYKGGSGSPWPGP